MISCLVDDDLSAYLGGTRHIGKGVTTEVSSTFTDESWGVLDGSLTTEGTLFSGVGSEGDLSDPDWRLKDSIQQLDLYPLGR